MSEKVEQLGWMNTVTNYAEPKVSLKFLSQSYSIYYSDWACVFFLFVNSVV